MEAAAYARYSTDRQSENSIAAQMDGIFKFCQANGHTITATYIDEAQTGTNTDRQGFVSLLNGAKSHLFEAVVIYDISRGSRDVADWFNFRKQMKALNIQILSATETLGDISNPNDFLIELINVGLGQHMVLQTRQKSIAGVAQKAKQGVFLGGVPPFGYDIVDGKYIINKHEAAAVRLIFEQYASGDSYNTIIDELAQAGYRGKRGQAIGKNSLHFILRNERYIGVYFWNKHKMKNMGKWAGGQLNPNIVKINDAMPSIIDIELWKRVQTRMKDNKRNAANKAKSTYLLSGLIECGECGGTYTGRTSVSAKGYKTRYYVCGNRYRTHTCKANNINADDIETAVIAQLKNYLLNSDYDNVADVVLEMFNNNKNNHHEEKKELLKKRTELANCVKAIANGLDFPELSIEIDNIRLRIAELEQIVSLSPSILVTREDIISKLKRDSANIEPEDIPLLIKTYVKKIYALNNEFVVSGGVYMGDCGGRI